MIITRNYALRLAAKGAAAIDGYTVDGARYPEHMTVTRLDLQRIDHYRVTDADAELIRRIDAKSK